MQRGGLRSPWEPRSEPRFSPKVGIERRKGHSMRKLFAISVLLNLALVGGASWKGLIAHVPGGGGGTIGNGGVNRDGTIERDAVYPLSTVLIHGLASKPVERRGSRLPATGQTKCYDAAGAEIDCASPDFPGQDGFYQSGCPNERRFFDNQDGTVTDNCTGLMWQKDTGDIFSSWQDALRYCGDLDLAGHADWRLPNVRELQSIVDYGRAFPAIDPLFSAVEGWYWSSSSYVGAPENAWGIEIGAGGGGVSYWGGASKTGLGGYVRAVRNHTTHRWHAAQQDTAASAAQSASM